MDNQANIPNSEPVKGINDDMMITTSGKPYNRKSAEATTKASKADVNYNNPKMSSDLGLPDATYIAESGKPMNDASKADVVADSKKNTKYKNMSDSTGDSAISKMDDLTRAAAPKINKKTIRKNT
jgi:hypothetical protein